MLEKEVTFVDFNNVKRTEKHYFNLTAAEVTEWMMTAGEYTLDKLIIRLSEEKNGKKIIEIFKDFMKRSYGRVSLDGREFEKSEEIWKKFYQSEAYSEIFMDIITDASKTASFINGVIPSKMRDEVMKAIKDNKEGIPAELKEYVMEG